MSVVERILFHTPVVIAAGMLAFFMAVDHLRISFFSGYWLSMILFSVLMSICTLDAHMRTRRAIQQGDGCTHAGTPHTLILPAQRTWIYIICIFCGGLCMAATAGYGESTEVFPAYDAARIEKIDAEMRKPSILYADFTIMPLTMRTIYMDGTALTVRAGIECFYNQQFALNTGAQITARVMFSAALHEYNDVVACTITDIVSFENSKGAVRGLDIVRNDIIAAIRSAFARLPASTSSFVHALFLGERTNLSPIIIQRFRTAGVSHLLALSGMHLAILTVLSTMVLRCFFSMRMSIIGNIIFIIVYVWIVGSKPSLNRAAIMLIIWSVMMLRHRKTASLNMLAYAFILLTLYNSRIRADLSFQLSFAALAGIMMGSRVIKKNLQFMLPNIISGPLAAAISAQIVSMPLLIYHFGVLYPIGIIASLALTPFIALYMWSTLLLLPAYYLPIEVVHRVIDQYMVIVYASIQHGALFFSQFPGYHL